MGLLKESDGFIKPLLLCPMIGMGGDMPVVLDSCDPIDSVRSLIVDPSIELIRVIIGGVVP